MPIRPIPVRLAAALLAALPTVAAAQGARLEGICTRLVIAGQDLAGACRGGLSRSLSASRASFDFAAADGQTLSFSGPAAAEGADQPVTLVVPGRSGSAGVVRTPTPAVGTCRVSAPRPGASEIACEARASGPGQPLYAATVVTGPPR